MKISNDFKELLKFRNDHDKATTIVLKQQLNPDELSFLQSLSLVVLRINENLHAKCYLNDERIIITSLNLYEFSMINNKEMGILLEKNEESDSKAFADALREVELIIYSSQLIGFSPTRNKATPPNKTDRIFNKTHTGYCIRTGAKIPFNLERPMSSDGFQLWNEYKNPDYRENYCHFSGELSYGETTYLKPVLNKNWKKAKEMYGL